MLPWVMVEAARLRPPDAVEMEMERHVERDRLAARRAVIADMYETNGPAWRDDYQRRMAAVKADEARLDEQEAATAILAVPDAINWSWAPEQVNAVLRAMWERIELDGTMQPVRAEWTVSEWRA